MNLDWYYTFIVMAETLNYRKAKEKIHLSEPSIHKQIKNLESYLNVSLFKTNGNKLFLTEEGIEFIYYAKKIIREHENGTESIKLFKRNKTEHLKIIVSSSLSSSLINDFLLYFFKMKPSNIDVSINLTDDNLDNKDFDICISQNNQYKKNFNTQKIYEESTRLFVPDINENNDLNEEIDFIKKYPVLFNSNLNYSEVSNKYIYKLNSQSNFINIDDINIIESFIRYNQGISYLPSLFKNKKGLKPIIPNTIQPPKFTIYLITNINKNINIIKKFKKIGENFLKSTV